MGDNDDDPPPRSHAPLAAKPRTELGPPRARVVPQHERDITEADERGFARDVRVTITETIDDADGGSRVRHVGDDPRTHGLLLTQRAVTLRERDVQQQRTKRQLAWASVVLLLGFAGIIAFAPQSVNAYIGAAILLAAAGGFGVKSFRIKVKDFELSAGDPPERPERPVEPK